MSPHPGYRDAAALDRRDAAQRRLWPITTAALAGGVALTAAASGLAWLTAPGASASSTTAASPSASSTSSSTPSGDDGVQPFGQSPAIGNWGDQMPQAVTGGS